MYPLAFLLLLLLGNYALAQVCLEHFSKSPFSSSEYLLGATPVPGHDTLLVAFSNKGSLAKINATTGAHLANLGTIPLASSGSEAGLLSLAFRFDFPTSGKFYTWGNTVQRYAKDLAIDEWTCADRTQVSSCTKTGVVLELYHMFSNHNGGSLMFDVINPTVLYLSVGDGGGGCDPQNTARNHKRLLGKILRIDVGRGSAANFNYTIPAANPIKARSSTQRCGNVLARQRAGKTKNCREIWVKGLRNPYRCSIDRLDPEGKHNIFCGDVGQSTREEVDLIPTRGVTTPLNYGWDVFEGTKGAIGKQCTGTRQTCRLGQTKNIGSTRYICPIAEETQAEGWSSLIGGYVCRTCGDPTLQGRFLYADYTLENSLRSIRATGTADKTKLTTQLCTTASRCIVQSPASPSLNTNWMVFSFAEDHQGRISLIHAINGLYRIVNPSFC